MLLVLILAYFSFGVLKLLFFFFGEGEIGLAFHISSGVGALSFYYISISFKHVYLGFVLSYYFATWS